MAHDCLGCRHIDRVWADAGDWSERPTDRALLREYEDQLLELGDRLFQERWANGWTRPYGSTSLASIHQATS